MQEDLDIIFETLKEENEAAIGHLEKELLSIRAGKANPNILHNIYIEYYGSQTPLNQASNINTPDGRTITVQPWEKHLIPIIEKEIMNANLGLNPTNNGEMIIINIPPLTEERRMDLVKQARHEAENAKVSIRNHRQHANHEIKDLQKSGLSEDFALDGEEEVQTITNNFIAKVDNHLKRKEDEIMTV